MLIIHSIFILLHSEQYNETDIKQKCSISMFHFALPSTGIIAKIPKRQERINIELYNVGGDPDV